MRESSGANSVFSGAGNQHPSPTLEHLIDQSSRGVDHASIHTTRSPAASLARKSDGSALPAVFASQAHEAMRQGAAFKVGAQLLLDMARLLLLGRARALQEGRKMLGEDSGTVGVFLAHGGSMSAPA